MDFGSPHSTPYLNMFARNTPRGSVSHFSISTSYESLIFSAWTEFWASKCARLRCNFRAKRFDESQIIHTCRTNFKAQNLIEAEKIKLSQEVEIEKCETDPLGEFLEQRSRKIQNPKMSKNDPKWV